MHPQVSLVSTLLAMLPPRFLARFRGGGFDPSRVYLNLIKSERANAHACPRPANKRYRQRAWRPCHTIPLYETWGFLPAIPHGPNGYRQYPAMHLEQAQLAHLSLHWPYLGGKALLLEPAPGAGDLGMANVAHSAAVPGRFQSAPGLRTGCDSLLRMPKSA